ncbi:MAG: SPFH domain-containing protein [Eubacteriales bacterium]|jgi:regulator of protease activity HflC (stomatin/prohibitin superfamily)|nr:SPFH domain-containing protein [Eubacteriales bacterium]
MSEVKAGDHQEIILKAKNGMFVLILNILLMLAALAGMIFGITQSTEAVNVTPWVILSVVSGLYFSLVGPILFAGLKVLKPNEALVLTLFGRYYGTLKLPGFYFVNPFAIAFNPSTRNTSSGKLVNELTAVKALPQGTAVPFVSKKISLKAMTLNNDKQKINDQLGNPIIIGIVVIWRVVNTAKAVFNVDNFTEFLSIQTDAALRNIVSLYPYDASDSMDNEKSLRGSSREIAERLKDEIQAKAEMAGLEVMEARITHLSYAPEIAAAMLQRQQASAIIDARQMIVEGAVGMVEMALAKLSENDIVNLDEERKAAMVSNLLVVLCGNKDAQPIVNSGSLY